MQRQCPASWRQAKDSSIHSACGDLILWHKMCRRHACEEVAGHIDFSQSRQLRCPCGWQGAGQVAVVQLKGLELPEAGPAAAPHIWETAADARVEGQGEIHERREGSIQAPLTRYCPLHAHAQHPLSMLLSLCCCLGSGFLQNQGRSSKGVQACRQ